MRSGSGANIFKNRSYLQRPHNLVFVIVVVALLGFTGLALVLADRLAQALEFAERGDRILSNLGALTSVLWIVMACRYGGDEIALIFPEAPLAAVVMRTNQLREAIFALNLEHFGRPLGKISVSFGVALLPQHGRSAAHLLQAAQRALKSAKTSGRNRVEVALARQDGA